ncbi:MAG: response regulator, partial [Proteobacteria bacterium]|nr:response regulator [Pseudomonadota bacterium]
MVVEKSDDEAPVFDTGPVNILVVDDMPEKILAYEAILEDLGQNVVTAMSGDKALKLVLKQEFAVILLDVNMPGMDGFEIASFIRQRKKSAHTPIIFLTAFTDEIRMAQGYASGAVDYIPTPVVPEILRAKVQVFIELAQMRRQAARQAEESAMRKSAEESARRSEFLMNASESFARAQKQSDILQAL